MNGNPKLSVVMPVFNCERFVGQAIESILNQHFTDFEFIIIDDGSTDRTREIIGSYHDERIKLIKNGRNLGTTKTLNIGVLQANGDFIARMDADDISLPERFQLQYDFLTHHQDIAVAGSWYEEIDESGKHVRFFRLPTDASEIKCYLVSPGDLGYYCVSHPTVIMRRKVLMQIGSYDEGSRAQDYELWTRVLRKYRIANIGRFLVKHRVSRYQETVVDRAAIGCDTELIIARNIRHYMPSIAQEELFLLTKMLAFRPQPTREGGKKVFDIFVRFFDRYTAQEDDAMVAKFIKLKLAIFYLPQLFKTNPLHASKLLFKLTVKIPFILFEVKLYRKIAKALFFK